MLTAREAAVPRDGGPWQGPTTEEWVARIDEGASKLADYARKPTGGSWIREPGEIVNGIYTVVAPERVA